MGTFEEIAAGVYLISAGRSNSYLLVDDDLTLVDTGMPGDGDRIIDSIKKIGRRCEELNYILITHAHMDHMGSVAAIKKVSGAQIVASSKEAEYIEGLKKTWTMGREGLPERFSREFSSFWKPFPSIMSPQVWIFPVREGRLLTALVVLRSFPLRDILPAVSASTSGKKRLSSPVMP